MKEKTTSVIVRLVGHEYRFACHPSEKDQLMEAAQSLNEKMQKIRQASNKLLTFEAVAVMAAMSLSDELLQQQRQASNATILINNHVNEILHKIDIALSDSS